MKTLGVIVVSVLLFGGLVQAQSKFHPTGIVLCPLETKVEGSWVDLIKPYIIKGEVSAEDKAKFLNNKIPLNWRTIREHELMIVQDQNLFSLLSLSLSREINYQLQEGSPNLMIFPVKDSVKAVANEYQKILSKQKLDWVINPYKVNLTESDGKKFLEVWIHLYYQPTNHLQTNTNIKVSEVDVLSTDGESGINLLLREAVKRLATTAVDRINRMR